jgi:hypothetical protein
MELENTEIQGLLLEAQGMWNVNVMLMIVDATGSILRSLQTHAEDISGKILQGTIAEVEHINV